MRHQLQIRLSKALLILIAGFILGLFGLCSPGLLGTTLVIWGTLFVLLAVIKTLWK